MNKQNPDFAHMLGKVRDAAVGGINAMSTGEALAAALVLNRPDWLASMNYTLAEAIDRIGPEWANLVPIVAREFERNSQEAAYTAAERARSAKLAEFAARKLADSNVLDFNAVVVTYSDAPGYRGVSFTLDLEPIGDSKQSHTRVCLHVDSKAGETICEHILWTHRRAWHREGGGRPLDAKPDEQRPRWID